MSGGGKSRGEALLRRKKVVTLTGTRGGRVKGRGVGDLRMGEFEELDVAVNTFIQFPELRTES
jgi:hypothetical protein